jgi:hypothetical protein
MAIPTEPQADQKDFVEALLSLHENPRGRQMLMVFKADRIVRLQPGWMDSARELWKDYYRLPGSIPNHTPTAPGIAGERP